ncbi:shikimate dehydrogenase [Alkalicoccobacillus gibsonii]|jgi:shikimate dehydrogenase|uniref:shikimate dehydrogenase n=1 Tax=Alkalicoccobacillus gibsonii TaxID=79881 RepID=UPI0019322A8C|nr:shikimate dehydrogenase [Alkalicoccobacillus gibsonii]MBM0064279.1 shikimate dehydrogenase [Alkalicoccobacillus gibsonii]
MKKVFGLLGHPIGHSMSPIMHEAAYKNMNKEATYVGFDVAPDQLEQAVKGIRALGISGCNVTIPHKVEVMNYLDEIDEEARQIGAVNTIVNVNGYLKGFNTDGRGYIQSLLTVTESLTQKNILVIGAGGAARAVISAMAAHQPSKIVIANRTEEKAQILADMFKDVSASIQVLSVLEAEKQLGDFSIIINTTSVGMSPNVADQPISLKNLAEGSVVSDLIYNPLETVLLKEAKQKKAHTLNGVGMFVQQGALSIEHWTGHFPDILPMQEVVLSQLKKSK